LKEANRYFADFRRELVRRSGIKVKYLAVPEFQKRGAVHYHVVFFNLPFIEQHEKVFEKFPELEKKKIFNFSMSDIWWYGDVKAILLDKAENVSAYISKYMGKSFEIENGNRTYGEKLYFTSRGLFRPVDNFDEKYIDNILNSDTIFIKSKKK
jgi:hypothetical protein